MSAFDPKSLDNNARRMLDVSAAHISQETCDAATAKAITWATPARPSSASSSTSTKNATKRPTTTSGPSSSSLAPGASTTSCSIGTRRICPRAPACSLRLVTLARPMDGTGGRV